MSPASNQVIVIRAVAPTGFRRCGVHHPAAETSHPIGAGGRFTEAEVDRLMAEPNLSCRIEAAASVADAPDAGGAGAPDKEPPTTVDATRRDIIKAAIADLDLAVAENVTKAGVPQVQVIEAVTGFDITADERNHAWAEIQEAKDEQDKK